MNVSALRKAQWQDPEYRAKMSAARKRRWQDPAYRQRMLGSRLGRQHTEETRNKMRVMRLRDWQDPEYRKRHVEPRRGGMTVSERTAKAVFENDGWTVLRNGWPDFLLTRSDGTVRFIEVKTGKDALSQAQRRTAETLLRLGIRVEVIRIQASS